MMIVMKAFTYSCSGHHYALHRVDVYVIWPISPDMGKAIDEPGNMEKEDNTEDVKEEGVEQAFSPAHVWYDGGHEEGNQYQKLRIVSATHKTKK